MPELAPCWHQVSGIAQDRRVCVDLTDVCHVDDAGRELITLMYRAGVRFIARGFVMPELVREISETVDRELSKRLTVRSPKRLTPCGGVDRVQTDTCCIDVTWRRPYGVVHPRAQLQASGCRDAAVHRGATPGTAGPESLADLKWFELFHDDQLTAPRVHRAEGELRGAHCRRARPAGPCGIRDYACRSISVRGRLC